jgi:manganese oxidase
MWGIFRVPKGVVSDLKPLPDRTAPIAATSNWPALSPGQAIAAPPATGEANPCPLTAPVRNYAVSAIHTKIVYNKKFGDNDPNAVIYVLAADEAAVKAGTKRPEPLILRANAGDCVKVTLSNKLPAGGIPTHTGDVPVPVDNGSWPKGDRVSMHASLAKYDVTRSDGATVGYNYDQTVAPGGSRTYTWYMEPEVEGSTNLLADFGDRRGHRHHGLWGGLMVEPKGSTWTDPTTGLPINSGTQADIKWTDASGVRRAQREFVIGLQDGMNLRDGAGNAIPDAGPADDPEDMGTRGINYRTERFAPRLANNPQQAWVMSSTVHGDPETPVFRAVRGDPVRIRLLVGQDRARHHTFVMSGHSWNNQPADPSSMVRSSRGEVVVGRSFVFDLLGGAGGRQSRRGDYVFRDGNLLNQTNQGLWGLMRVFDGVPADLKPL